MALIAESVLLDLIAILTTVTIGIIAYKKWKLGQWQRDGLPFIDLTSKDFLLGRVFHGEISRRQYEEIKSRGYNHAGAYGASGRVYIPIDPELIKLVLQKDFNHFMSHGTFIDEVNDPLSGHLFNLEDTKWRNMRVKLTPTFTSGKMKMMFQTIADCTKGLTELMDQAATSRSAVEIKDILARFTTDVIGSAAFGLECNSIKDPNTSFRIYGKKIFEVEKSDRIKMFLRNQIPRWLLSFFRFKLTKSDVEKFFLNLVKDTVSYRENNNVYRKDFMHLLIQLKNKGEVTDDGEVTANGIKTDKSLTINELAAQAFLFFIAGFETSSTTMTFAMYELAVNQDIQEKLREEVKSVLAKHDNQITYDAIMSMTYLDKVINETLRKYPPVPTLPRRCTQDYTIPNTSIRLRKGDRLSIPVVGLHYDSDYYPQPEVFDPERFSEENKNSRPAFTWIPFGEGPRICIGLRFGVLQSKIGLTSILQNHRIRLNSRTISPLTMDPKAFISSAKGGVWVDIERIP